MRWEEERKRVYRQGKLEQAYKNAYQAVSEALELARYIGRKMDEAQLGIARDILDDLERSVRSGETGQEGQAGEEEGQVQGGTDRVQDN